MSFQNQLSHEVRSFTLLELAQRKDRLAHLGSIQPVMANYDLHVGWFSTTICNRHPEMEMCSDNASLSKHLAIKLNQISPKDRLAVNSVDAAAISTLLR